MKGSVVKRTDKRGKAAYYVVIDERDETGKRRRRWRTDPATGAAFTKRAAADAYAATLVSSIHAGNYVEPSKETVGSWLDMWLQIIRPTVRLSTWASYEKNVRLHIKPHLGDRALGRLTAADCDRLYATLLAGGRLDHKVGQGLSPRTVRYIATILGRALKDAVRKGLLTRNPAEYADPPRASAEAGKTMQTFSAEEGERFLEAVGDHRYGVLFVFLALTGVRRGEALAVRWRDVDFDSGRVSIRGTVGRVAGKVVVGATKTARGSRAVALDAELVQMIRDHRVRQAEQRLLLGSGWRDLDLVFPNECGDYKYPETVSRAFRKLVASVDLPSIRLHDLRHTWATLGLQSGVHPKVVQERLGHANVGVTIDIYSHVAPILHDEAAETVASLYRGRRRPLRLEAVDER